MKKNSLLRIGSLALLLTGFVAAANASNIVMPTVEIDRNGTATVQLSVNDGNPEVFNYQAFQFDLFLPAGITVDSYSLDASLTAAGFEITQTNPSDGTYRYIAFSAEEDVTTADFMTLVLKADASVVTGDLTAKIQNVVFSAPNGQDINLTNSEGTIAVKVPVTAITLNKTAITLYTGTEFQLTATLDPADSTETQISWTTSAATVASVGSDGIVKALEPGTSNITATCDGVTVTCVVTVKNVSDDDINVGVTPGDGTSEGDDDDTPGGNTEDGGSLIGNNLTLRVGQTAAINLTIDPAPEYDPNLQWKLDDGGDEYVTMTLNPDNSLTASFTGLSVGETIYTISLPNNGETVLAGNIKVIAKDPIASITLTPSPLSMPLNSEPVQITTTVAPANASIQTLVWSTSDEKIATVTDDGKVSPVALGECDITATSTDGSGISATCHVTVTPVVPTSITIDGANIHTLKTTGTLQLTASVTPDDTTYPDFTWSSLQPELATVSETGLVTAIAAGTVTIKATVDKYPDVYAEYQIVITDRLLGDANDNGTVNVADIVTIADYINGRETWQFSFVNANVDDDDEITTNDIEGTLNIIKGQTPVPANMPRRIREVSTHDTLIVDNFHSGKESLQTIGFALDDNSHRYSSLEAVICLPEGMTAENVRLGEGAANHTLNYNVTDDGKLRVVIYSLDSTPFQSWAPLMKVEADAKATAGDLTVEKVLVSNSNVELYELGYEGGRNVGMPTGVETVTDGEISVKAVADGIEVLNASGLTIEIYAISGETVATRNAVSNVETFSLASGVYVVKAGETTMKIKL